MQCVSDSLLCPAIILRVRRVKKPYSEFTRSLKKFSGISSRGTEAALFGEVGCPVSDAGNGKAGERDFFFHEGSLANSSTSRDD